ncbi:MAG TPA: VOC family protein [Novosphingobium sp.]|nr:VOC family protein [Novosphingobium sp.]
MRYLHTMVRVTDLEQSLDWYQRVGLVERRRFEVEAGRFTVVFISAPETPDAEIELTYNWDPQEYDGGRNFGHIAFEVDDIYAKCRDLLDRGIPIVRPPRDGYMAFVRSPDNISIEILQKGEWLKPAEPWVSMPNIGTW